MLVSNQLNLDLHQATVLLQLLLMWNLDICEEEELEDCWSAASFLVRPEAMMGFLFTTLLWVVSYNPSSPSSTSSFPLISDNPSSMYTMMTCA